MVPFLCLSLSLTLLSRDIFLLPCFLANFTGQLWKSPDTVTLEKSIKEILLLRVAEKQSEISSLTGHRCGVISTTTFLSVWSKLVPLGLYPDRRLSSSQSRLHPWAKSSLDRGGEKRIYRIAHTSPVDGRKNARNPRMSFTGRIAYACSRSLLLPR